MCLIGHLPFLFLLFQHFLYLDSTRLQQADSEPVLPSLPKGCNHCHTDVLDSLVRMRDATFIPKHAPPHPPTHPSHIPLTLTHIIPLARVPLPPSFFPPPSQKKKTRKFTRTRASWVLSQMVLMTCAPAEAAPSFSLDW